MLFFYINFRRLVTFISSSLIFFLNVFLLIPNKSAHFAWLPPVASRDTPKRGISNSLRISHHKSATGQKKRRIITMRPRFPFPDVDGLCHYLPFMMAPHFLADFIRILAEWHQKCQKIPSCYVFALHLTPDSQPIPVPIPARTPFIHGIF